MNIRKEYQQAVRVAQKHIAKDKAEQLFSFFLNYGDEIQDWRLMDLIRHVANLVKVPTTKARDLLTAWHEWSDGHLNRGEFLDAMREILHGNVAPPFEVHVASLHLAKDRAELLYEFFIHGQDVIEDWKYMDLIRHIADLAKVPTTRARDIYATWDYWKAGNLTKEEFIRYMQDLIANVKGKNAPPFSI